MPRCQICNYSTETGGSLIDGHHGKVEWEPNMNEYLCDECADRYHDVEREDEYDEEDEDVWEN